MKGVLAVLLRTVGVGALLVLVSILVTGGNRPLADGSAAPGITGKTLDDRDVQAQAKGPRPLVVNLWATWCAPCMQELPHFVVAAQQYKDKVDFIGLAADSPKADVLKTQARFSIPYPLFLIDAATQQRWNAQGLPSTYLVDADGHVRWSITGAIDARLLQDRIEESFGIPPP